MSEPPSAPRPDGAVPIETLAGTTEPEPFAPGADFWTDPYIAEQLLDAHLDPERTAASRPHDRIDAEVDWLVDALSLEAGDRLLDLGCGPGLYCERFADRGLDVTGVDVSATALERARRRAAETDRDVTYRQADYRSLEFEAEFDAAVLVFFDFGTFDDADRTRVLRSVDEALVLGGRFAVDVRTAADWSDAGESRTWDVATETGFWRPNPHLVLSETVHYPEVRAYLDQHLVVDDDGTVTPYRFWERYYDQTRLRRVLTEAGFAVEGVWADLTGSPVDDDAPALGVVARAD